jgi:FkbM family methyltransferase
MRFILAESFNLSQWNGRVARHEKGVSGSHNGIFYLAEGLAKHPSHTVEVVSIQNNVVEETYNNVKYTNFANFDTQDCDYLVVVNVLTSLEILQKIRSYKKIIIQTHNDLFRPELLNGIPNDKVILAYISEFAKTNILMVQPFLNKYASCLIYNSFDVNDIQYSDVKSDRKKQLCFFACLDRGYKMVEHVVNRMEDYSLLSSSYSGGDYSNSFVNSGDRVRVPENTAKYTIFKHMLNSRYFIYPLINLDNNMIHYDTFAYCVLEAILHGVIVIVPRIRVFEELYGDAVCYIDTTDIIPKEDLLYWKKRNSNFGIPLIERYIAKVRELDANDALRNSYIEKGAALKYKFCNEKITREFLRSLDLDYKMKVQNHLTRVSSFDVIPSDHLNYLRKLKNGGFEPKVIYDIGSCVLHWTKEAKRLWPNAKYILFDAFSPAEFLYNGYDYNIGPLSKSDGEIVKFYQNDFLPGGNSYYREIGSTEADKYFPEDKYVEMVTSKLDTIVKTRGYPLPDFVKIDVQGSELDVIRGGVETLKYAKHLIIELQHTQYNKDAPLSAESIPIIENELGVKCEYPLFCNNGADGDYGFVSI